ncbi:hypothetical protein RHMOL_Rhmol06G0108400 [Rhododendron molle]|uniref:Uncharacterized protein n=2 Tax=Rhododendron molle TaxID=49168 RepID=A0ACC0ND96_RHOML|nr:hypothetical protein RHMOL_Rhmol06G0108400 [Rhododendron molle]KAI8550463.1 hypothetical protein RHMOL_Rhmol06G0108400 [Rhododendron molle]
MTADTAKCTSNGCENPLISAEQRGKIDEVRRLVGTFPDKLTTFSSDASISRYLRAQNWNVNKAAKLIKETLKWRLEYKPEAIKWDEVAVEAATGKMYRSNYRDKYGRPVIVMRPSRQNSKSVPEQIRYLVHCMENAILNLPEKQEEMVWLVDFSGFNTSNISLKSARETAYILRVYYPERLGLAILYNPPKFFEPFWKVAKLFSEPKITNKVKFVYSEDPNTLKIMEEEFDVDQLESAFGGKDNADFDFGKYSEWMIEDDKRMKSQWKGGNIACEAPHQP